MGEAKKSYLLEKRKNDWNMELIREHINEMFKSVELVEGWKFVGSNWIKSSKRKGREELKKSIYRVLRVKLLNPSEKEVDHDIQVPELIDEQFFYINGNYKIPIFQLFDLPIIYRNDLLKLKTNTLSASIDFRSEKNKGIKLNLFNKKIPLELLICAFHSKDELTDFMNQRTNDCPIISIIYQNCLNIWNELSNDEIVKKVGHIYATSKVYDEKKIGESILFSLKAAIDVDKFTIKYFKTSSVVFEILNALYEGFRSDTDLKNKRVRFTEYILSPLIKKIYNLVLSIYKSSKVSFKIPQTTLVDVCNVSDIVHHNLTINPVTEIASLCQITLTGPGGFKKSNVPAHLKNINDTHFGRICPADTPDRDGCGVILNMVPTVKLNSLGMFEEPEENNIISYPISLTPFLEHDDQIRLQMASSQIKQSIYIRNSESPNIKSGLESEYLNKSTFLNIAKNNGEVIYLDDSFMVVKYQDGTGDVFKLKYKELYLNTLDYVIPCFNMGDMFKEGEVLSHSTYIKNDELTIGQNLLTGIGIWKGFNYEDGIVISDRLINEQKFTSIHNIDLSFIIDSGQVLLSLENDVYKPLPVIGEKIKKGGVCAKIKTLVEERGCESINIEPHEITAPLDCKIINIEIYPNTWNKKVDEFNKYIEGMQWRQINKFVKIYNELIKFMSKEEADNFCKANNLSPLDCKTNVGKYTIKDQKFTGVLVKISAIYKETIGIGDKIANRHGNKGVISKILPRNKMPKLEDGRVLDIILNPLGIISRMNVGQLYELHLSECLYQIKQNIKNIKDINDKIKYLSDFLDIIDIDEKKENSKKILKEFELNNYDENILFLIQTPFKSIGPKELMRALEYSGAKFKQSVFDPTTNSELKRNIAVGYNYFLKLVHRASDKISSRSIGPYSQKTMQPLGGKSNQGGHRVGEMEVWALESHGATKFLKDLLTVHSDSSGLKNKLLSDIIQNPSLIDKELTDTKPQSLRLLESYLKILGLEINFQEETDGRK